MKSYDDKSTNKITTKLYYQQKLIKISQKNSNCGHHHHHHHPPPPPPPHPCHYHHYHHHYHIPHHHSLCHSSHSHPHLHHGDDTKIEPIHYNPCCPVHKEKAGDSVVVGVDVDDRKYGNSKATTIDVWSNSSQKYDKIDAVGRADVSSSSSRDPSTTTKSKSGKRTANSTESNEDDDEDDEDEDGDGTGTSSRSKSKMFSKSSHSKTGGDLSNRAGGGMLDNDGSGNETNINIEHSVTMILPADSPSFSQTNKSGGQVGSQEKSFNKSKGLTNIFKCQRMLSTIDRIIEPRQTMGNNNVTYSNELMTQMLANKKSINFSNDTCKMCKDPF